MLILTRRIGEKIVIGDDIQITAINIRGNQINFFSFIILKQSTRIIYQEVTINIKKRSIVPVIL